MPTEEFDCREENEHTENEKADKWFAVEIKYAAPTKRELKRALKDIDPKRCPTIIRGHLKPTKVEKNPTLVF